MSLRPARLARWLIAVAAAVLGSGMTVPGTVGATTTPSFTLTRIAGPDLYATAAAVATSSFGTASTAILATSASPYDAGVAAYLSGALHAPILLTRSDALPGPTSAALGTLHAKQVLLIGGKLSVNASVVDALQGLGLSVTRIYGSDRYATAAAVATDLGPAPVGTSGGNGRTAILVSGYSPGDLQVVGPMAFAGPYPVLLAGRGGLDSASETALQSLGIDHVVIVGGPLAVPASLEAYLASRGITAERVAGANVLETAARLANFELAHLGFTASHVDIARGDDFADAVTGGPHAGLLPGPMLLAASATNLGGATTAWLANQCPTLTSGHVLGGPLAISDAVMAEVERLATTCGSADTGLVTGGTTGGTTGGSTGGSSGTTPTGLVLTPESAYAASGTSATVTATVTSNGTPVAGVPVDFFVTDTSTEGSRPTSSECTLSAAAAPASTGTPCVIDASDPVTNAAGTASFTFHWVSPVGKRPIEGSWPQTVYAFTGALGTGFSSTTAGLLWDDAAVLWVNPTSSLVLEPAAAVVHYGETAQIQATILSTSNEGGTAPVPLPDQVIRWSVYRDTACVPGASTPPSGAPTETGSATTDANGTAFIRYLYAPEATPETNTVDCLFAYYDQNNDTQLQSTEVATTGTVTWSTETSTANALTVTPASSSKLVASGESQLIAARVTDQYGTPVPGVDLTWSINRAGSSTPVASGLAATDANGTVSIPDPSPSGSALDTVAVSGLGGALSGQASVYWVVPAPSGSYPNLTVIGYTTTSETTGAIDVADGTTYLRLAYDGNDILRLGTSVVHTERFTESLTPGASLSAEPYAAEPSAVSTFVIASTSHGGGGGGGNHGSGT